ncbi:hypothetical protein FRAHR75_140010 [Frankia sp. Hr75.2]|nr:hypothetical protein FRAHR75_140010 [Frankia sp. Hr75.2]
MTTRTAGAPDVGKAPEGPEEPAADVVVTDLSVAAAGGRAVLDGASCDLPAGGTLAVIGTSGAGKTTFALALLGHLGPGLTRTSGGVTIGGVDVFAPRAPRARPARGSCAAAGCATCRRIRRPRSPRPCASRRC